MREHFVRQAPSNKSKLLWLARVGSNLVVRSMCSWTDKITMTAIITLLELRSYVNSK